MLTKFWKEVVEKVLNKYFSRYVRFEAEIADLNLKITSFRKWYTRVKTREELVSSLIKRKENCKFYKLTQVKVSFFDLKSKLQIKKPRDRRDSRFDFKKVTHSIASIVSVLRSVWNSRHASIHACVFRRIVKSSTRLVFHPGRNDYVC